MIRVMSTVVWLMSILDFSNSQSPGCTCDQLPQIPIPNKEVLLANSPYRYDYTLTSTFDCSGNINVKPPQANSNFDGTALIVQGFKVITIQYTYDCDGKSMQATLCNTGEKRTWYSSASEIDYNGAFFCLHTCNGTQLTEFICFSNNNCAWPKELQAVALAKQVPNGRLIHDARANCTPSYECQPFY